MTWQKTPLDIFIPEDRRQALFRGETLPARTHGAVLFADISGFTALTNILSAELGAKRGAEELIRQLDPIYTNLVQAIHNFRGSVIVISGDGITCWFDQDNGRRATSCAFRMQEIMAHYETIRLPTGQQLNLAMRITLSVGDVQRFLVGDPNIQLIEAIAGREVDEVVSAQQLVGRGEIAVSARLLEEFEAEVTARSWCETADGSPFVIVEKKTELAREHPWPDIPELDHNQARKWVFASVYNRLRDEDIEFLTELRQGVPMFVKFTGLDYDNDDQAGEKLDRFIRRVQQVLTRYEGYLCQLTIGDKGSNVFIAFGAPVAHEDDIDRALGAALLLRERSAELGFIQPLQISLTYGQIWTGAHGGKRSRTYSVMGAEVNLAARLMGHADPGQILVSPHIVETTVNYLFAPLPPIQVKGVQKPLTPFLLLGKARAQSVPVQQTRMIGRVVEQSLMLQRLTDLTHNGKSPPAGLILIEGEAGIGKSLLLADFVERAAEMGVRAFMGHGDPVERSTAYYGIRPVFEALFGLSDEDELVVNQQRVLSAIQGNPFLMDRLPLLSEVIPLRIPDNELTEQMTGEARATSIREFLLEVFRHLLFREDHPAPATIILDDAQWLDSATWNLLGHILRELPRVQLVISMRSPEPGEMTPQNEEEYRRLRSDSRATYISLGSLPEEEVINLLAHTLRVRSLPTSVLAFIQARAQGNPFFCEEIAFALRDAGVIQLQNGEAVVQMGPEELDRMDFPRTIQGVITSRIDRLSPAYQLTLKVASVIGRAFLINILSQVHPSRVKVSTLVEYLTTLTELGITELETPTPELTYLFKHVITQEVVYNLLTFSQRKQLHRAIAEWYEASYAEELAPYYPRLAHHWLKGEVSEKAISYLDKAAEQALELYSNADAVRFLSIAMELADRTTADSSESMTMDSAQTLRLARWERMLGVAHSNLGQLPEALKHFKEALKLLGRPMPQSTLMLIANLIKEVSLHVLHRIRKDSLHRQGPGTNSQRDAELARIAIEEPLFFSQNVAQLGWAMLRRLNLAEQLGMPGLMAEGYGNLVMIAGFAQNRRLIDLYRRLMWEAVAQANRSGTRLYCLAREALTLYISCDWNGASKNFELGKSLAEQLGDARHMTLLTASEATTYLLQGKYREGLRVWQQVYERALKDDNLQEIAWGLYGQGHNILMLGQTEEAIVKLEASLGVPIKGTEDNILNTSRYGALSLAYQRAGSPKKALMTILAHEKKATPPSAVSLICYYSAYFDAVLMLSENVLNGNAPLAGSRQAQLTQLVSRVPKSLNKMRNLPANNAGVLLYRGVYLYLTGKHQQALVEWKKCIEQAKKADQPYELARAAYEIGHRPGADTAGRQAHLARAIALFEELGTVYELHQARAAMAELTSASRD